MIRFRIRKTSSYPLSARRSLQLKLKLKLQLKHNSVLPP
jgi:hypothetical protein